MQAIILSGGKGTRLHPLTLDTPKPMLSINGIPHLEYQIRLLKQHGFDDIIFSTGYLHEQIESYFGDGSKFGVRIRYKEDGERPLGTAGAIKNCLDLITQDAVIVLNGDILTDFDLKKLAESHYLNKQPIAIGLTKVKDPTQFGVAVMNGHKIRKFIEKPSDDSYGNLINAGVYSIFLDVIEHRVPKGEYCMLETDIFPHFAAAGMVSGYISDGYWLDIGTHERYQQAQDDAKKYF